MRRSLIDTDVLSAIMRKDAQALTRARAYLGEHHAFTISIITRYEVLRGLKAVGAAARVEKFDRLCETCEVLPITDAVVVRAADIYGDLKRRGALIGDADILIAATALVEGLGVVTNNEEHFNRVPDLHVESWLR
ncbi:MAG: type II toxin-antitoxin system VapC family toxin [Acidobacteriota bacterium]